MVAATRDPGRRDVSRAEVYRLPEGPLEDPSSQTAGLANGPIIARPYDNQGRRNLDRAPSNRGYNERDMIKRPRSTRFYLLSNDKRAIEITDSFMTTSVLIYRRLKWKQILK